MWVTDRRYRVVKYIERQSGSPVVDLTEENHLDFARSSRVAVIAFLDSDNQLERKTFDAVADRWRAHYSFGSVHGLEKDSKGSSIAVYTQEEEAPVYYRGPFTVTGVEAFLHDATQPLIREYDPIVHEEAMKVSILSLKALHRLTIQGGETTGPGILQQPRRSR